MLFGGVVYRNDWKDRESPKSEPIPFQWEGMHRRSVGPTQGETVKRVKIWTVTLDEMSRVGGG